MGDMNLSECSQNEKYPKLFFKVSDGYLEKALEFSKSLGFTPDNRIESLEDCLESLNRIAENSHDVAILYQDFVKHSFYFILYDENSGQRDFNGGIILHGYQETFSVELNPSNKPHWSIHT